MSIDAETLAAATRLRFAGWCLRRRGPGPPARRDGAFEPGATTVVAPVTIVVIDGCGHGVPSIDRTGATGGALPAGTHGLLDAERDVDAPIPVPVARPRAARRASRSLVLVLSASAISARSSLSHPRR
jgi:hypothetical protein